MELKARGEIKPNDKRQPLAIRIDPGMHSFNFHNRANGPGLLHRHLVDPADEILLTDDAFAFLGAILTDHDHASVASDFTAVDRERAYEIVPPLRAMLQTSLPVDTVTA